MPRGYREMKRDLEKQPQINKPNLSPSTLEAFAENKRKVDAGLLPRYVGGTVDAPSNPESEKQAKRLIEFTRLIDQKMRSTK